MRAKLSQLLRSYAELQNYLICQGDASQVVRKLPSQAQGSAATTPRAKADRQHFSHNRTRPPGELAKAFKCMLMPATRLARYLGAHFRLFWNNQNTRANIEWK